MEPSLRSVQETSFLSDCNEIPEMTKLHDYLLCFVSIGKPFKVFVQAPFGEEPIANG
jgi:hypothetical protein